MKPEIYDLVKQNKAPKKFVADNIITASGLHKVLRLPPYHCDLNPIEMVWGITKNYVARQNTSFKLADIMPLVSEGLDTVKPSSFKSCIKRVQRIEDDYWRRDALDSSPEYNEFKININPSTTDTASETDCFSFNDFSTDTATETDDLL